MTPAVAVGIDVGATKLAAALVDLDAAVLAGPVQRRPTLARRSADAVLGDCVALARAVLRDAGGATPT